MSLFLPNRRAIGLQQANTQRWIDYVLTLPSVQGCWPLSEPSGTRYDYSVNGNNLADNGTVTHAAGPSLVLPDASHFTNASGEYLDIADNASLSTGNFDWTFSIWAYLDSNSGRRVFASKWLDAGSKQEWYLEYLNSSNLFRFFAFPNLDGTGSVSRTASTFGAPSTATWYWVLIDHDSVGNTVGIQINNGTRDSSAYASGFTDGAAKFTIGALDSNTYSLSMDGRLAGAVFQKSLLTTTEKTRLYQLGGNVFV